MASRLVPMVHVPDVRATADWYRAIGFEVAGWNPDDSGPETWNWALLRLGAAELMLNIGGRPSDAWRREVDLYIHSDDLDADWARLRDKAEVVEPPHETDYGRREFIVRDLNRFWLTFGQSIRR